MRILGFSKMWPKLQQDSFSTFRFTRRDRDWEVGELAQVVYKPRRKGGGDRLGVAEIVEKVSKHFWSPSRRGNIITIAEAIEDGFKNTQEMRCWMLKTHGDRVHQEPLDKLTLKWVERRRVNESV